MGQLSDQATAALADLARATQPDPTRAAVAWAQIEAAIERRERPVWRTWQGIGGRGYRVVRRYVRSMWKPALVMAIVALTLGPILRSDVGGAAYLESARELVAQGEHRRAYDLLVVHSRLYKTRRAAEARMGLVLDALCGLKMRDKAEADLQRYLSLNPESIHRDRVAAVCPSPPDRR